MRFGLEVHPTEIAYDFVTTRKALDAIGNREAFGINLDPSHFAHQHLDTAQFALEFADRIYHVHVKDSSKRLDGRARSSASHLNFGEEARGWDFVSPGHGDVDFEEFFRALNRIGYHGPLSIEWEDTGMDRDWGAPDALAFVRRRTSRRRTSRSTPRCKGASDGEKQRIGRARRWRRPGTSPEIGVGMLGYAFMGKAHSNAFQHAARTWPGRRRCARGSSRSPAATRRRSEGGRARYGYER